MPETIFVINPNFPCALCGERFGGDSERDLVLVESGQLIQHKKDLSLLTFLPDHENEFDPKTQHSAVVEYYHADCLIDRMRGCEWGSNSPHGCDLCGSSFRRSRWAFRLRMGQQDEETSCFVPVEDPSNESVLCPGCITEGFGEGSVEEGELLLGIAGR